MKQNTLVPDPILPLIEGAIMLKVVIHEKNSIEV